MKFVGLELTFALQVFAGLAIGFLILYLLKLRRRRITVPFSPLWSRVLADKDATSWIQRLKRLLSLLLMLFISAAILFALLDPQPTREIERGKSIVILIDTSASMASIEGEGRTRLQLATEEIGKRIEAMGPHDKMMLIAADGQVRSLTGEFTDKQEALRAALAEVRPTATEAEINEGIRTAVDSLESHHDPKLVLFSDGAFGENYKLPEGLIDERVEFEHILVGETTGNVSITGFNIRRYLTNKLDYEVFIQVQNHFDREIDVELTIYNMIRVDEGEADEDGDGFHRSVIDKRTLHLGPGGRELRFFKNLARGSDHLSASIRVTNEGVQDALRMDDSAFVLVPAFDQANVLVITPGNLFLEAAFILNNDYEVFTVASQDVSARLPGAWESASTRAILKTAVEIANDQTRAEYPDFTPMSVDDIDAYVFDNSLWAQGLPAITPPADGTTGNFLYINPRGPRSPFSVSGSISAPIVERVYRKHPLSRWLVMKDLNITEAARLRLKSTDKVAVRAISGPLIVTRRESGANMVAMAFSILASDIVFRVALPVLLLNTVDWFQNESNSLIQAYHTGENWHIPVPTGVREVDITYPDGKTDTGVPTHDNHVVLYGSLTGFYTVRASEGSVADSANAPERWEIASNFKASRESKIKPMDTPLESQEVPEAIADKRQEETEAELEEYGWIFATIERDLWIYVVLIVLGLLIIEWTTFHRRITV